MENTSGRGRESVVPPELAGWNWGAFLLNWIWGIGNNTFIALLMFVPIVNIPMAFILGAKGNAWAWRNQLWASVEHFKTVQRKWAKWAVILYAANILFVVIVFMSAYSSMKNSEIFQAAEARLRADPRVTDMIGQPLSTGFPMGSVSASNSDGEARLTFSVEGPKGSGMVRVDAVRDLGEWKFNEFVLLESSTQRRIDLLEVR